LAVEEPCGKQAAGGSPGGGGPGENREAPADAEPDRAEPTRRDIRLRLEKVEHRDTIRVELRDRRPRRVVLSAHPPRVVVRNHEPRRLDAVVDLWPRDHEPVPR